MWDDWGRFKPSKPRAARGGIKAQLKQGKFGESWWAKRWIGVLESFNIGSRLARGRSYARSGQVLEIQVEKGGGPGEGAGVAAPAVLGHDPAQGDPARGLEAPGRGPGEAGDLRGQAARGRDATNDIEKAFEGTGLSLFPSKLRDLQTNCSCPDSSNPCKHIAAVYYLIGEEFDRDPFLIFTLRGLSRDKLVALLGRSGATAKPAPIEAEPSPPEPLSSDLAAFWGKPAPVDDPIGDVEASPVAAALPRRLGGFPFWRGQEPFLQVIEPTYARATPRGLDTVLGQAAAAPPEAEPAEKPPAKRGRPRVKQTT